MSVIAGMAAASIARDLSNEVDRLTRDLAETRAERDAAQAVLKSIEWAAVGYVGYYVPCQACPSCRGKTGYANCYYSEPLGHAPDCALAAVFGSVTPSATLIASEQTGEHFTVTFEGSVLNLDFNPLLTKTLFGRAVAVHAVDALATRDTGSAPAEPAADRDGGGGA